MVGTMNTSECLAEYAELLNNYGPNSKEAQQYLDEHCYDTEFTELAILSRKLKVALTAPINTAHA